MTQKPLDICLCTQDMVGPVRNGGIGTAYHSMALALLAAGHRVTVLYAAGNWCERGKIKQWVDHYKDLGIDFVPVPYCSEALVAASPYVKASYEGYCWLSSQEKAGRRFDIIHFHEWRGVGFYSVLAKREGLHFGQTVLCVGTHSPELWHQWGMKQYLTAFEDLQADHLERVSVELADVVVSPSRYMVQWMKGQGWKLNEVQVRQNILSKYRSETELANAPIQPIKEIVFFGRLETRKGLILFCDAIDQLNKDTNFMQSHADVTISFLGKKSVVEGMGSGAYIESRSGGWRWPWKIVDDLDHQGALEYLSQPNRLAIMPSLIENSPYTLLECVGNAISCICTDLPGNRELIAADDAARVLFQPRPISLSDKLKEVIEQGLKPALPAVHPEQTKQQWLTWHEEVAGKYPGPKPSEDQPLVSVCMAHRNRPKLLSQALESIRRQDYPNVQLVLVDDGSDQPEALEYLASLEGEFAARGWKLIRQSNKYLGAARNAAARASSGEWLLFMDDDNVAMDHEISTFVKAAQCSGADVITCISALFRGKQTPVMNVTPRELWLPLGGAVAVGMFMNLFGDANGFLRREVYDKVGGFTEDFGVTHEDWEFYARVALAGFNFHVLPEPLFWYRVDGGSMLRTTCHFENHMRSLRPYETAIRPELRQVLAFAQGLYFGQGNTLIPPTPTPAPALNAGPNGQPAATAPTAPNSAPVERNNPQRVVDEYWNSLSWRISGVIRTAMSRVLRQPAPPKPRVATTREAMIIIEAIRTSISWEATGPLRALGRTYYLLKQRRGANSHSNGNGARHD